MKRTRETPEPRRRKPEMVRPRRSRAHAQQITSIRPAPVPPNVYPHSRHERRNRRHDPRHAHGRARVPRQPRRVPRELFESNSNRESREGQSRAAAVERTSKPRAQLTADARIDDANERSEAPRETDARGAGSGRSPVSLACVNSATYALKQYRYFIGTGRVIVVPTCAINPVIVHAKTTYVARTSAGRVAGAMPARARSSGSDSATTLTTKHVKKFCWSLTRVVPYKNSSPVS